VVALVTYSCDFTGNWGWRLPLGLAAVPGVIVFLGGIVLPESPISLIERGYFEKAWQVSFCSVPSRDLCCCISLRIICTCSTAISCSVCLACSGCLSALWMFAKVLCCDCHHDSAINFLCPMQVLSKTRGTSEVNKELADMIEAARISNEAPHPMRNLFKPQYCPQLTISLLFMMFQQFTGINVMVFYAPVLIGNFASGNTADLLQTVIIGGGRLLCLCHCCWPAQYACLHMCCWLCSCQTIS
jgi:hypothetical protein